MSHPGRRVIHALGAALLAAAALAAVTPAPAHAQFGKLFKKAKKAVAVSATSAALSSGANHPPQFDETTVELTSQRVAGVINGLEMQVRILAGTSGNDGVNTLRQREAAALKTSDAIGAKHQRERDAYDQLRERTDKCRINAFTERIDVDEKQREARSQQQDALDSAQEERFKKEMMAAASSGDMQKMGELQKQMVAMVKGGMTDTAQKARDDSIARADTAAVDKQCGKPPAKPHFLAQQDSLDQVRAQTDSLLRALQERAQQSGYTTAGMTQLQYAMAIERIRYYVGGNHDAFSGTERDALAAKHKVLQALLDQIDQLS